MRLAGAMFTVVSELTLSLARVDERETYLGPVGLARFGVRLADDDLQGGPHDSLQQVSGENPPSQGAQVGCLKVGGGEMAGVWGQPSVDPAGAHARLVCAVDVPGVHGHQ